MPFEEFIRYMPDWLAAEIADVSDRLTEVRLRAGNRVQLVGPGLDLFVGESIGASLLRSIALRMMDYSYYSREAELAQGFFTLKNGFRVGVCGSYAEKNAETYSLSAIGSLCIRVAREVPGCAKRIVGNMIRDRSVESLLILSRPGLGKTTILRDAARLLSENGWTVGIADERHEIAACRDGIPTLNVGSRSDVADGLPKNLAIIQLIRSMAPQVIVTDEIGCEEDIVCLREAVRRGVAVIASAHASSIGEFEQSGMGVLVREKLFSSVVFLDGRPGNIADIRRYD